MKHPLSLIFLLFSLFLPAAPMQAADDVIEKTYCTQGIAYESIDDLKLDLLNNAKKAVINELFGEFIIASTAVENFVVTKDQIQTSSLGFVRVDGNTNFHNGKDFAEVCVTIEGYVTAEDLAKFDPERLEKKYCDADDDMTTTQLIAYVKDEAIIQALVEYDPKLKGADKESLLQLMQKVTYLESGFISDTQTYCAKFEGQVVPVEVMAFLETEPVVEVEASPKLEGLVAYYSFDDESAKDESGNGYNGSIQGNPTFIDGIQGKALKFDGIDDYVALPSNTFVYPTSGTSTTPFSFAIWFKTSAQGVILGQQALEPYDNVSDKYVPAIYIGTDGKLRVEMFWRKGDPLTSPNVVNDNTFHHLAVVYDGIAQTIFLDGLSIGNTDHVQIAYNSSYKYQFGTGFTTNWVGTNGGWSNFTGVIDEAALYNRALTSAEVQTLFNADNSEQAK